MNDTTSLAERCSVYYYNPSLENVNIVVPEKQIKALLPENAHSFIMRIVIFSIREKMWIEKLW